MTITYNLAPNVTIEAASRAIEKAVAELHLPDTIRAEFAGDAKRISARSARSRW